MDTHPNKWCLPCGYLDWDEGIHNALIREVFEEVGINIDGQDAVMYHINDGANADGLQNVTFHFYVCLNKKAAEIELKLSDEVQDAYWLTSDEITSGTFQGKEAAFGHFERIKKAVTSESLFPLHVSKLDVNAETLFEY